MHNKVKTAAHASSVLLELPGRTGLGTLAYQAAVRRYYLYL